MWRMKSLHKKYHSVLFFFIRLAAIMVLPSSCGFRQVLFKLLVHFVKVSGAKTRLPHLSIHLSNPVHVNSMLFKPANSRKTFLRQSVWNLYDIQELLLVLLSLIIAWWVLFLKALSARDVYWNEAMPGACFMPGKKKKRKELERVIKTRSALRDSHQSWEWVRDIHCATLSAFTYA